jgi:hypothetical protein
VANSLWHLQLHAKPTEGSHAQCMLYSCMHRALATGITAGCTGSKWRHGPPACLAVWHVSGMSAGVGWQKRALDDAILPVGASMQTQEKGKAKAKARQCREYKQALCVLTLCTGYRAC